MATITNLTFTWQGTSRDGKPANGEITAANETLARMQLRRQGINPKKLARKRTDKALFGGSIKTADISAFSRQLATMINAGIPLVQSLDVIMRSSSNPKIRNLVKALSNDIQSGTKLRDSLAKYPKYFDYLYCNLIGVGEEAGVLPQMLDRIALHQEKSEAVKKKIKKALMYPAAIVLVAIIVSAILLIKVVPQFQSLFAGFGAQLPAFTQFVINLSNGLINYWFYVLAGIIAFIVLFVFAKRFEKFRFMLDVASLRLPIFGKLVRKGVIARFSRTLSTTFSAGMPLVESLKIVAMSTGNMLYEKKILEIRDAVSTGRPLNLCMEESKVFPLEVVQMVAIGEETGAIDQMLGKIAAIYEEEVDIMVDGLSSLMEPLIICFIGIVVGGLVIAMYLPIFELGSVV